MLHVQRLPWYLCLPSTKYAIYPKPLAYIPPQTCSVPFVFSEWHSPCHLNFSSPLHSYYHCPIPILLVSHIYLMPEAFHLSSLSMSTQTTTLSPLSPSLFPPFPSCPLSFHSPTETGMIFFWHKYNQAINVMPSLCCEHFNVFLWLLDKNQNFKCGWQDLTWSGLCHVSHLIL